VLSGGSIRVSGGGDLEIKMDEVANARIQFTHWNDDTRYWEIYPTNTVESLGIGPSGVLAGDNSTTLVLGTRNATAYNVKLDALYSSYIDIQGTTYFKVRANKVWTYGTGGLEVEHNLLVNGGDIGITADTNLLQLAANALTINGTTTIGTIAAGAADYDKFLVSHGGIIKYRTGAQVLSDIGGAPAGDSVVKAWINFNGTGVIAINDSFNVTSITDNGTGNYTVTWDTDFANTNYAVTLSVVAIAGVAGAIVNYYSQAVGSIEVLIFSDASFARDEESISAIAIGDQ